MKFIIYSKDDCPVCDDAIRFMQEKGLEFDVLKFGVDFTADEFFAKVPPGIIAVPQIFRGKQYIGGFLAFKQWFEESGH